MHDLSTIIPLLKWLGIGAGGTGVVTAVFVFWAYTSITSNKKRSCNNEAEINKHNIYLAEMTAIQKEMNRKLDRLIDIHINGTNKRSGK